MARSAGRAAGAADPVVLPTRMAARKTVGSHPVDGAGRSATPPKRANQVDTDSAVQSNHRRHRKANLAPVSLEKKVKPPAVHPDALRRSSSPIIASRSSFSTTRPPMHTQHL